MLYLKSNLNTPTTIDSFLTLDTFKLTVQNYDARSNKNMY